MKLCNLLLFLIGLSAFADDFTLPPSASPQPGWVFHWTESTQADSNPQDYITKEIDKAKKCFPDLQKHLNDGASVACDDNATAGPGVYAVDNPFKTHDYGRTLGPRPDAGGNSVG
jgi:hypothetical protein